MRGPCRWRYDLPLCENRAMITFESVTFEYRGACGVVRALDDVDLEIAAPGTVCVVGANGSGKSTLALLCDGLLVPTSGTVEVEGLDTSDPATSWEVRSRVGLVLQDPDDQIVGTSVEADAAFGPENLGVPPQEIRERVSWALAAVGLPGLEEREPHLLSEGQKQRLAIAGALAMRPDYLVVDEPTSMLDPEGRADVANVLARLVEHEGTGIVHITHRLEEITGADRVVALFEGRVVFDGTPDVFLDDPTLMRECGVAPPLVWDVASHLRSIGVPVPSTALTAKAIGEALWS
jgi:energy-coupling factor transport system ATP-binding protein